MNINIRRILKGVVYSTACVIMISVIGSYSIESVDNLFTKKEVKIEQKDVLGVMDEEKVEETKGYIPKWVKEEDYVYSYFKDADLVVEDLWNPEGYAPVNTLVNTPEYEVKAGDVIKDSWDLDGKAILSLECDEISDILIKTPAYWGSCKVTLGDYVVQDDVRADIYCKVYGGMNGESSGCTQQPVITYYRDKGLKYDYLVLGAVHHGSGDSVRVYQIDMGNEKWTPLYFDLKDTILESKLINNSEGYFMSFTSNTKEDFRFVTVYHDPAMAGGMLASYNEWKMTNGRLLLDRNIVSVPEGTFLK